MVAAAAVLREMTGVEPELALSGGSLPVQAYLLAELGVPMITFGFSRDDDGAHSVDESHLLESFTDARAAYTKLLDALAASSTEGAT